MKYYAVIDTNVLVSYFLTKNRYAATYLVIEEMLKRVIVPLYNAEIMSEYEEVLSR